MKNHYWYVWVLLCVIMGASCKQNPTQSPDPKQHADAIKAFMEAFATVDSFNGTIMVAEKGTVIYKQAFGIRDPRTDDSLKPETPFYLASVAKHITCMTLLMLEEQGKLSIDEPLSAYFPELPYADSISIRQMMTHTSGIPDYYDMGKFKPGMTNQDVLNALLEGRNLDFPPGSKYSYSNSAYVLLSMITEKAAGQSYHDYVHEHIFGPLEMNRSYVFDETKPEMPNRAIGFTKSGELDDYHAYTTGGGGIFSSVLDMLKWERALHTETLVSQEAIQRAYQPMKLSDGTMSHYGFGWMLNAENPNQVKHTGALAGFRTIFFRDLEKEQMIILLSSNTNLQLAKAVDGIREILSRKTILSTN